MKKYTAKEITEILGNFGTSELVELHNDLIYECDCESSELLYDGIDDLADYMEDMDFSINDITHKLFNAFVGNDIWRSDIFFINGYGNFETLDICDVITKIKWLVLDNEQHDYFSKYDDKGGIK